MENSSIHSISSQSLVRSLAPFLCNSLSSTRHFCTLVGSPWGDKMETSSSQVYKPLLPHECILLIKPNSWASFCLVIYSPELIFPRSAKDDFLGPGRHASLRSSYDEGMDYSDWLRPIKTLPWSWERGQLCSTPWLGNMEGRRRWILNKHSQNLNYLKFSKPFIPWYTSLPSWNVLPTSFIWQTQPSFNSSSTISASVKSFGIPYPKRVITPFHVPFLYPRQT